jgi:hypothetical protein
MIDLSGITSRIVHDGYAYWLSKKAGHAFPARQDIDPLVDTPRLVPNMMLKDFRRDPPDIRYRLIGTQVRRHLTRDWTGTWMSDIPFQRPPSTIWSNHMWVVENRMPLVARPPYVGPHKDFLFIESIILPLGADRETVDMLMVFVDFVGTDGAAPAGD